MRTTAVAAAVLGTAVLVSAAQAEFIRAANPSLLQHVQDHDVAFDVSRLSYCPFWRG